MAIVLLVGQLPSGESGTLAERHDTRRRLVLSWQFASFEKAGEEVQDDLKPEE